MSPPVTPATALLVVEPASVSAGMLPLLPLLLDRQVAQLCKEEPPAQAGGFFVPYPFGQTFMRREHRTS